VLAIAGRLHRRQAGRVDEAAGGAARPPDRLRELLGLSFYARTRIGVQRWRALHRYSGLAWILSIGHALGAGTDAGRVWFLAAVGMVCCRRSRCSSSATPAG
jgi:hypothetical protein